MITAENQNLAGTIFTEIGQLSELKEFELSQTGLSGQIPTEVGMCASLEVFDVCTFRLSWFLGIACHDSIQILTCCCLV